MVGIVVLVALVIDGVEDEVVHIFIVKVQDVINFVTSRN